MPPATLRGNERNHADGLTEGTNMSDDTNVEPTAETGGKPEYTPPATQDDLNRIIADRISRERAKFADYDDLRNKAAEYDKAVESQKSEIEKATERAEAAEKALAAKEAEALRHRIAGEHGVPADLLSGSTEDELTASAQKLIEFRGEQDTPQSQRFVVPDEGGTPGIALNSDGLEASLKSALGIR